MPTKAGATNAKIVPDTKKPGRKRSGKSKSDEEKVPVYEPNIPEPTCRAELMKYWINLTLDEKTSNKLLWVTDNGTKVRRRTEEVCPYFERPERFELSPQVLCKEAVWGFRGYWEVEYTGWVVMGATCEGLGRKRTDGQVGLGENEQSWGFGWDGSCYNAWVDAVSLEIRDVPRCPILGMYMDQPAGLMNFYIVQGGNDGEEKEVKLLHSIKATIEQRALPGFWIGVNSTCTLLRNE